MDRKAIIGIFRRNALYRQYMQQEPLWIWAEVVDANIGRLTTPLIVKNRVLHIEVTNHVVQQELSMMEERFVEKINARLSETNWIKGVRFQVIKGQIQERTKARQAERKSDDLPQISLDEAEDQRIEEMVRGVEDDRLKRALMEMIHSEVKREWIREQWGWKRCFRCGIYHDEQDDLCVACRLETT
ncbi:MAG: DciA family protein [Candidatus Bipolaricaulia bacterium]